MPLRRLLPLVCAVAATALAACSGTGAASSESDAVPVVVGDDTCDVGAEQLPAGVTRLALRNDSSRTAEVYVYGEGDRIVAEKENIGPGTGYELTVDLAAGSYEIACDPGMDGDQVRSALTVAAGDGTPAADPRAAEAVEAYRTWVQEQADALVPLVDELAAAVAAGDRERAMALYAPSREPWERIEPVAESFGDLDPRIDAREADLAPGEAFTGWHRLEKALWTGEDLAAVTDVAEQLTRDVRELQARVPDAQLTPASIGNGAKELLDEVATGKVTGEEEAFSHTDLVDFAANVEGAAKALEVLEPLAAETDPELVATLHAEFDDVRAALETYRSGDGFVSYDTVDEAGRRELARVVDALSEPLSRLAAAAAG